MFTKSDELLSSPEILFHIQSPHLQTLPFFIVAPSSSIEECLVFRRTYTEIFWALTFSISGKFSLHHLHSPDSRLGFEFGGFFLSRSRFVIFHLISFRFMLCVFI